MENMKVRLEHNTKNDPYTFKESVKVAERDQFYQRQEGKQRVSHHGSNPIEKIIHGKMQPEPQPEQAQTSIMKGSDYKSNFKP